MASTAHARHFVPTPAIGQLAVIRTDHVRCERVFVDARLEEKREKKVRVVGNYLN